MQESSREVMQKLLYHTHPENFDLFLKYFEEKERLLIAAMPKEEEPLALHLDPLDQMLHRFHYSWFIPCFEKFSSKEKEGLLTIFSIEQQQKLEKALRIKIASPPPSKLIQKFFLQWILKEIGFSHLPPSCLFPRSDCLFMLKMTKNELVKLLHHLAILELANITKKIVDKKMLKETLGYLSERQTKQFHEAQKKYAEPLSSSTKDLAPSLEEEALFVSFFEKKGILRLAKALAAQNSYFIWHLAHILDKGRGQEFLSIVRRCSPNPHTLYYTKQMLELCPKAQEKE